jgi:hypothetical protein
MKTAEQSGSVLGPIVPKADSGHGHQTVEPGGQSDKSRSKISDDELTINDG